MRILYVATKYPLPVNNGAKIRTWTILQSLAALGHEVTLIALAAPGEFEATEQQLRTVCSDYEILPLRYTRASQGADYWRRAASLFAAEPFVAWQFRSANTRAVIENRLNSGAYDLVFCDIVYAGLNIPPTSLPMLVNSQNLEFVYIQRYVEQEKNPLKRLYAALEMRKMRRLEAQTFRRGVVTTACSEVDAEILRDLCPGLPVYVVPNVVDADEYSLTGEEEPDMILYQAAMDWFPNCDGLEFFVRQMLPRIQAALPHVRVVVAGRNPSPEFRGRFADVPAVTFTGTLPDLRPLMAKAAVSVIPLRIGSGTRLKILEGGAMGKAMVSTTIGAEGLDFQSGRDIFIADDPEEFADRVIELLSNPQRRKELGEAAKKRVLQDYDMRALRRSLENALAAIPQVNYSEKSGSSVTSAAR